MDRASARRGLLSLGRAAAALVIALLAVAACDSSVAPTPSPTASEVAVASPSPAPSPTPSPSPTPTPSPTPSPSPTPTPAPTASPSATGGLVAPCPGTVPTTHRIGRSVAGQSRNWSGYVATGVSGFSCIEATWVQPKVRCRGTSIQSAVYWVGLGGFDQRALVQVGTESVCDHGVVTMSAWHESLPRERFSIRTGLPISVGDRIWGQVRWIGGSRYRISLADLTNRRRFAVEVVNKTLKRTSAEWIVEAPTGGCPSRCHTLKMPDFGTFRFSGAWTTIGSVRRQLDADRFTHSIETMVNSAGSIRAEVTTTGASGTSFAVRWRRP